MKVWIDSHPEFSHATTFAESSLLILRALFKRPARRRQRRFDAIAILCDIENHESSAGSNA